MNRQDYAFHPIQSTEPSFNSTLGSTSQSYVLETTDRIFQGPAGRAVRVAACGPDSFNFSFGTSDVVVVSTGNMAFPGGMVEVFYLRSGQTHVAVASSTDVTANFTLGYGR